MDGRFFPRTATVPYVTGGALAGGAPRRVSGGFLRVLARITWRNVLI